LVRPKTLLAWIAGVLVALAAILYAGDFLWFESRMQKATSNDPLETVTFYYATAMKNGKVEVFYDQPQTQTCVRSIFPHSGYTPCWRFNRSGIQRISRIFPLRRRLQNGSALGADAATAMERAPFFPTERTAKK
jgi:hypothetical protein